MDLSTAERVFSIKRLEDVEPVKRLAVLVDLATDCSLSPDVGAEVGRAVARAVLLLSRLDDVPLADFCGPAYVGYDEQVAAYLRQ